MAYRRYSPKRYAGRMANRYKRKNYRRYKKKGGGYGNALAIAKTALSAARFVKGLVNAEHKYFDTTLSNAALTFDGAYVYSLTSMAQGDTVSTRNGDSIKTTSLDIKLWGFNNFSTSTECTTVRTLIIQGCDEGAFAGGSNLPTLGELYVATGTAPNVFNSFRNPQYTEAWVVLREDTFSCSPLDCTAEFTRHYHFNLNHHIKYVPGSPYADSGGLYLIALSTSGSGQGPNLTGESRLRYIDN